MGNSLIPEQIDETFDKIDDLIDESETLAEKCQRLQKKVKSQHVYIKQIETLLIKYDSSFKSLRSRLFDDESESDSEPCESSCDEDEKKVDLSKSIILQESSEEKKEEKKANETKED